MPRPKPLGFAIAALLLLFLDSLCFPAPPDAATGPYPLEPAGLPGTLILTGTKVPINRLLPVIKDQIARHPGQIVCLHDRPADPFGTFLAAVEQDLPRNMAVTVHKTDDWSLFLRKRSDDWFSSSLLWIHSDNAADLGKLVPRKNSGLARFLQQGSLLLVTGRAGGSFCDSPRKNDSAGLSPKKRACLLEHVLLQWPTGPVVSQPGMVTLWLSDQGSVRFSGRSVSALGSTAESLFELPASSSRSARQIRIPSGRPVDLTAIRRAAWDRSQPPFPPVKLSRPSVEHGSLLIVGGGGLTQEMVEQFLTHAGGSNARIVIIPTAEGRPRLTQRSDVKRFRDAGAASVTILHTRDRQQACSEEFLEPLRKATGVWFGGGRQWRLVDAYEGTPVVAMCHEVLQRGGIIGGSSAGATIQGEYLVRGHPLGNTIMMAEGYERGFAFLPGTAIDQHFTQRKRQPDLQKVVQTFPQVFGIGIDETTAILVQGGTAQVLGKGTVSFYHPHWKEAGGPQIGKAGDRYDFRTDKLLPPAEPRNSSEDKPRPRN